MSRIRDMQRGSKIREKGGQVTRIKKATTFPLVSLPYKLIHTRYDAMIKIQVYLLKMSKDTHESCKHEE